MVLALMGTSLAAGKRTNCENSLTSSASVETSRSIKREHSWTSLDNSEWRTAADCEGSLRSRNRSHAEGSAHKIIHDTGRICSEKAFERLRLRISAGNSKHS